MKTRSKIVSIICLLAMLLTSFATVIASAFEYTYETPVDPDRWSKVDFDSPSDYAYSIAFVGDTQYITCGDYYLGTNKLYQEFNYIAKTAEERKLEHVFVLGDITDLGYKNDGNLAAGHNSPPITGEWEIAQKSIFQLNETDVTYQLCRGNHDDYMMDDYFNVPEYTDQFKEVGGFYSDSTGKHPARREKLNPDGYIYWSAKSGYHKDSIVNSWMTKEICGTKYLFITVDYNPTAKVLAWVNEILAAYPDHKAIVTTHAYVTSGGHLITSEEGNTMYPLGITGQVLWDYALSKHENVFMVVSGHVGITDILYSYQTGVNGNKVLQVLVDPQSYDAKEINFRGDIEHGIQDTGLVLYMNFSEDGSTISFDYYSTLLNKFLKDNDYVLRVDDTIDEVGSIDMAGFEEYGQVTPLVSGMSTPTLDGVINDGEYLGTKVTASNAIGKGMLNEDLNEYFAYDDEYVYYAFSSKLYQKPYTMNLHFGSSIYNVSELNDDIHGRVTSLEFDGTEDGFKVLSSDSGSWPLYNKDFFCSSAYDKESGICTYEIKIKREYLRNNNSPDNLLSYSLNFGTVTGSTPAEVYYKLPGDAKDYLAECGVTKKYLTTYNYVYFGTRPETVPEEISEPTEQPTGTTATDTSETEPSTAGCSGCGSSMGIAAIAIVPVIAGVAVISRKKKDND